ncbi:septum formation protein Maf [Paenibacillus mesophilus]|uniref:Maf family protein n=1 Tax=Paenibacillus mesophilus TaxID=2582849 RepID=UPI00110D902C|nr:Maf family protein [Paenibacillus mesophilus]TMV52923.1 septum formation protein Maf [Paenibacillus mesophilus]
MTQPTLILASGSPRRQELIRTLGLPFTIDPADVDETMPEGTAPDVLVEELSLRKARAVAGRGGHERGGIVIGSDTVVVLDGRILGKPRDEADAFDMLKAIAGRTHQVYTGITCIDISGETVLTRHEVSDVTIKPLDDDRIRRYIATGEPADKAGAYAVQGIGALIVKRIEGDYFNVVGMSVRLLGEMLEEMGVRVL